MTDLSVLQTRLTEAEAALHKLMTGAAVVSVGYGDDKIQYAATDLGQLRAYIAELKIQTGGSPRRGRAIGVRFG